MSPFATQAELSKSDIAQLEAEAAEAAERAQAEAQQLGMTFAENLNAHHSQESTHRNSQLLEHLNNFRERRSYRRTTAATRQRERAAWARHWQGALSAAHANVQKERMAAHSRLMQRLDATHAELANAPEVGPYAVVEAWAPQAAERLRAREAFAHEIENMRARHRQTLAESEKIVTRRAVAVARTAAVRDISGVMCGLHARVQEAMSSTAGMSGQAEQQVAAELQAVQETAARRLQSALRLVRAEVLDAEKELVLRSLRKEPNHQNFLRQMQAEQRSLLHHIANRCEEWVSVSHTVLARGESACADIATELAVSTQLYANELSEHGASAALEHEVETNLFAQRRRKLEDEIDAKRQYIACERAALLMERAQAVPVGTSWGTAERGSIIGVKEKGVHEARRQEELAARSATMAAQVAPYSQCRSVLIHLSKIAQLPYA